MRKLLNVFTVLIILMPIYAHAYTECDRPINLVWNSLSGSESVWVTFDDGGSAIFKAESQLTEGQMARFVSYALTAQASDRSLIVRYPEDGLQCPPVGAARNDAQGIWITGHE